MLLTTFLAASSSPKARTVKKLVSTRPGDIPDTRRGRPLDRAWTAQQVAAAVPAATTGAEKQSRFRPSCDSFI
jgi:hypothetical protein